MQKFQIPFFKSRGNRLLSGLIIAMSFTLFAFEYTVEKTHAKLAGELVHQIDSEEIPPIITFKTSAPKPPTLNDNKLSMKLVEDLFKTTEDNTELEKKIIEVDPNEYGMEGEDIPYDELPKYEVIERYPHLPNCSHLSGKAQQVCGIESIRNSIRANFQTPEILRSIGAKQGVNLAFTVAIDGSIQNITILNSTHIAMSKAATEALKKLSGLIPASQNGRNVAMQMEVPLIINFGL